MNIAHKQKVLLLPQSKSLLIEAIDEVLQILSLLTHSRNWPLLETAAGCASLPAQVPQNSLKGHTQTAGVIDPKEGESRILSLLPRPWADSPSFGLGTQQPEGMMTDLFQNKRQKQENGVEYPTLTAHISEDKYYIFEIFWHMMGNILKNAFS